MASYFLAPDPLQSTFFIPGGAVPGSGAQLFTYLSGSSTKTTVYKDNAGSSSHTNPIVMDSGGNIPSGGVIWIPSGVTIKVVYAPSNDTDPPASPYRTIDNIAGINDITATASEWLPGPTPTFVNATQFTLVGDQTATFTAGRRVKTTNTAGTIYSTITVSAFAALTTVTVISDSGGLDSGLSAVSYALLAADNPSTPLLTDSIFRVSGSSDRTKKVKLEVDGLTTATTRTWTAPDTDLTFKIPSVQAFTSGSGATYTTPAGARMIKVRMIGGGGSGAGGGTGAAAGATGSNTTFSSFTASAGTGGLLDTGAAPGGAASGGTINIPGGAGSGGSNQVTAGSGGGGGNSALGGGGGGGSGGSSASVGTAGATNSGGGGGGGGVNNVVSNAGGGGGSGGYVESYISSPSATYTYTVGGTSTGGAAGTNGSAGGNGAAGVIIVEEFY